MMLRYDDKTTGIDSAKKGDSVTIAYEMRDQDALALSIKPNLAKLPEGVTEIKTAELQALVDKEGRPAADRCPPGKPLCPVPPARRRSRFPSTRWPRKRPRSCRRTKNKLLVFYCGGPT